MKDLYGIEILYQCAACGERYQVPTDMTDPAQEFLNMLYDKPSMFKQKSFHQCHSVKDMDQHGIGEVIGYINNGKVRVGKVNEL